MYFLKSFFAVFVLGIVHGPWAIAETYKAFSFGVAKTQLETQAALVDAANCAGISKPMAIVFDEQRQDLILVGQVDDDYSPIRFDDWAVAARAVYHYKKDPAVSIDPNKDSHLQTVRFEGGLEDTQFGDELLQADIVLKRLGLGLSTGNVFGAKSYFDLSVEDYMKTHVENKVLSRFWFYPHKASSYVTARKDVVIVEEYRVGVNNEVMGTDDGADRDPLAEQFAGYLHDNYTDVQLYYPELRRLEQLYYVAALVQGMESNGLSQSSMVNYWLHDYVVQKKSTPRDYPLERNSHRFDNKVTLELSGGVTLDALVVDLQDAVADSFKDYIIKSRPSYDALSWEVPLVKLFGNMSASKAEVNRLKKAELQKQKYGMNILKQFNSVSTATGMTSPNIARSSVTQSGITQAKFTQPRIDFSTSHRALSTQVASINYNSHSMHHNQAYSNKIGGVMLKGAAKVEGDANVDLGAGNFSFVVDGDNARLSPQALKQFVTALWAVYYSDQDPGISIDPIAPGSKKHLVRYIGKVINSDLGRVMRDADYVMKKWAVGTERPAIAGFKNPDDVAAERGHLNVGAWSRFWFVPKDMRFKRAGDLLLFESGRMTVQTEYMFQNGGSKADPSNESFAEFFTANYNQIAEKYPVYRSLFDYAKMVSFAKYLKDSGIPLLWYLLAYKDQVVTEDSPGTVDALVKGSNHFRNVTIEGGVELGFQGNYVYDEKAVTAINTAMADRDVSRTTTSSLTMDRSIKKVSAKPFSFDLGDTQFTVLPQHSLTSGTDRRGIRYQTDIAVRDAGLMLTKDGLDDLYPIFYNRTLYKNLKPYRNSLEDMDKKRAKKILSEASADAHKKAGNLKEKLATILDVRYKNEHQFRQLLNETIGDALATELAPIIIKHAHYKTNLELVRYFNPKLKGEGEFGDGWRLLVPYRLEPEGKQTTEFLNVIVPRQMALVNLLTNSREVLTFSKDRYSAAGYVPDKLADSQHVGIFIMSDASYRLADKLGNEFWFDQAGNLSDMIFSEKHKYHFEYQKGATQAFAKSPYQVQLVDNEEVPFLNAIIKKNLRLVNLQTGQSETLTFNDKGRYAGYLPQHKTNSPYEILVLMSDTSYRLLDKRGNEFVFSQGGRFVKTYVSSDRPLVKSISQGTHTIKFSYTVSPTGNIIMANVRVIDEGHKQKEKYRLAYHYSKDGKLANVTREGGPALAKSSLEIENKIKISQMM